MYGMMIPTSNTPVEQTPPVPEAIKQIIYKAKGRVLTLGEIVNILVLQGHKFEEIRSLPIDYIVNETDTVIDLVHAAPNS
jgi:hypothetical protein